MSSSDDPLDRFEFAFSRIKYHLERDRPVQAYLAWRDACEEMDAVRAVYHGDDADASESETETEAEESEDER